MTILMLEGYKHSWLFAEHISRRADTLLHYLAGIQARCRANTSL